MISINQKPIMSVLMYSPAARANSDREAKHTPHWFWTSDFMSLAEFGFDILQVLLFLVFSSHLDCPVHLPDLLDKIT